MSVTEEFLSVFIGCVYSGDAMLSSKETDLLRSERVARMATINQQSKSPHVVPVCFAFDGEDIYTSLGVSSRRLKNIEEGSKTSVLIDKYEEENNEWKVLCGLLIYGSVNVLAYDKNTEEFMHGWRLLIEKYSQYKHWANPDFTPKDSKRRRIIKIVPSRITRWGFS
jgi:nitroimidazol reductase NimA-like FMN-containing flavoprotein (pyridoxamine 5'-phosphate oxidase superfamily)